MAGVPGGLVLKRLLRVLAAAVVLVAGLAALLHTGQGGGGGRLPFDEPNAVTSSGLPVLETVQQQRARERQQARKHAASIPYGGMFSFPPSFWPRSVFTRLLFILAVVAAYYGASRAVGNGPAAGLAWLLATGWVVGAIVSGPSHSGWEGLAMLVVNGMFLVAAAAAAMALYWSAAALERIRTNPTGAERDARELLKVVAYSVLGALAVVLLDRLF